MEMTPSGARLLFAVEADRGGVCQLRALHQRTSPPSPLAILPGKPYQQQL